MDASGPKDGDALLLVLRCDDVAEAPCFLGDIDSVSRLIIAAFASTIGVMAALLIAVALLPAPAPFLGVHPIILPSHSAQLRVEPREKAFVGLALALGFATALLAITVIRRQIELSKRTIFALLLLIPLCNIFSDNALNQQFGAPWAFFGLVASMAVAWISLWPMPAL